MSTPQTPDPVPIPGLDFVAIDFETANRHRGSACSVGLIRVRAGLIVKERHWLMRPPLRLGGGQFEARNITVHGINYPMVAQKPTFGQYHPWLVSGLADDLLVAHNAAFDSDVLRKASEAVDLRSPDNPWVCTVALSRAEMKGLPGYKLPQVTEALGLPPFDHHDALADARACARVLIALVARDRSLMNRLPLPRLQAAAS